MLSTSTVSSSTELERPSVESEVNFNTSQHAVIIFLIPTLGAYVQLQYQSQNKSSLEEHPKIMVAIYVNLFLYGLGLIAEFKLKTQRSGCLSIIKRITPLFGILVVVLILIILYPVLGFVAFVIWALVAMEVVIKLSEEFLQWFQPISIRARDTITGYFNRTENRSPGIQDNGSSRLEANDLLEENESRV